MGLIIDEDGAQWFGYLSYWVTVTLLMLEFTVL